ncbi:glycosyltransferase family 4 protein [Azospirillum sp. SYSU D00513]|uniref:glycosyltransferase family 4 protein n=1 Tax=Azospirillum sp. SYSU D00513 TaxID=2812561 RepID=UPI001A972CAC|nr:glycosyltransferase family 4 protein [Azospirillum sp. SYSU D00513]
MSSTVSAPIVSVCIVTHEFAGLPGSGGIGTAFAGLAEALAAAGHAVTVLCTGLLPVPEGFEAAAGITFVRLLPGPVPVEGGPFLRMSYDVFDWLSQHRFDVVHFADWTGLGFCATAAKRQGLAFAGTSLVVGLHGPTRWVRSATGGGLEAVEELAVDFLERRSAEQADVVVSPSRYLLGWVRASGWALPGRTEVRQNILPHASSQTSATPPSGMTRAVRELVFFGRLETRKGVTLFCDALDQLRGMGEFPELRITFLGGSAPVEGEDGAAYVRRRASAWPWAVTLETGLPSSGALAYLRGEGRLAVIPSRIENSPCTVAECLIHALPFVASRVGGTEELVAEEDLPKVLFEPDAGALAEQLAGILREGAPSARLRLAQEMTAAEWCTWHVAELSREESPPAKSAPPAGYVLLADPRLRLLDGAAERMAGVAARTGAAVVTGAVDDVAVETGSRRFLGLGGPAALAPWRDPVGPGPLLVRRDLAPLPDPDNAAERSAWLSRLLLAGHRIDVIPLPLATAADPAILVPCTREERLRPFLSDADETVADLVRLAIGFEAVTARALAERDGLASQAAARSATEKATPAEVLEERRARLAGLLGSSSWRLTAPVRRLLGGAEDRQLMALPPERAVDLILGSVWWDLVAPWRLVARLWRRLRGR